jgi:hypothetical protein
MTKFNLAIGAPQLLYVKELLAHHSVDAWKQKVVAHKTSTIEGSWTHKIQIGKAVRGFASFKGVTVESVKPAEVAASSMGIEGWAGFWDTHHAETTSAAIPTPGYGYLPMTIPTTRPTMTLSSYFYLYVPTRTPTLTH